MIELVMAIGIGIITCLGICYIDYRSNVHGNCKTCEHSWMFHNGLIRCFHVECTCKRFEK